MVSDFVVAMALPGLSLVALLSPFEAQTLRKKSHGNGMHLRWPRALLFAVCTCTAGVGAFVLAFVGLGFGVPCLMGDMVGLPWITAFPALLLGGLCARLANRAVSAALLGSMRGGV